MPDIALRPAQGIVWIASYPRSGNTWVRTFISALIDVGRGNTPAGINQIDRHSTWESGVGEFRAVLGKDPRSVGSRELAKARQKVQERVAAGARGRIFVKTHLAAVRNAGEFTINWRVTQKAVYLVRNPLDVACSLAAHYNVSIDDAIARLGQRDLVTRGKSTVPELVGSWSQNVASWTDQKLPVEPLILRYEDMLAKPFDSFAVLADYLGGGVSGEHLRKAVESVLFERLRQQEQNEGFKERPGFSADQFFRKGTSGQWQDVLTKAQVDRVLADHSSQMRRFGYGPKA
jgi:hypothetical protein